MQKIRNQKFSALLKIKGEFLAISHTISLNKGRLKHNLALVLMQMCAY